MLFNIKELGVSASYEGDILSLSSGQSINVDEGEWWEIPHGDGFLGVYSLESNYINDDDGNICDVAAIRAIQPGNIYEVYILNLRDGGYKRYSSDMADGVVLSMYGWEAWGIEGLNVHKDPRYNIDFSLDTIKAGRFVPNCKAIVSCAGGYGETPRTYFVKGKVSEPHTNGVCGLETVLKSVEKDTYHNVENHYCTGTKYTISEYKDYYLLAHYYGQCPELQHSEKEPLCVYYKVNKGSFRVSAVSVSNVDLLVEEFIGVEWESEILMDRGIHGKNSVYNIEDMCNKLLPLYYKEDLKKISDAFVLALTDITKYASALGTNIDYFEFVSIGGELVYANGGSDIFPEVIRKTADTKGFYLCASSMIEKLGFVRNENGRTGLKGSVAACIAHYDRLARCLYPSFK
jgi:hypothetical protein